MPAATKLTIVIASAFYSEGMGYSENCLSRALARLGHDVHVVTSTYNVYSNEPLYDATYREFLGPPQVEPGTRMVDGYHLHRLESTLFAGYVRVKGLTKTIRAIAPDIVHSLEAASLQMWELALGKSITRYKLFCESHQNMSVMQPYMRNPNGAWLKRARYRLTRTFPTYLAGFGIERCYATAPDCAEVARRFYGVPAAKIAMMSLGADTDSFHPVSSEDDRRRRDELRGQLGYTNEDIVCIYTGRFTSDKNALILAEAIDQLSREDERFKALFVGNGVQRDEILTHRNTKVVSFMTHRSLSEHYRAADIGVWPRQESMSMIDAAASGLPLIVSNRIGEPGRVSGNGKMYDENNADALAATIRSFENADERLAYGAEGRRRMLVGFTWDRFAKVLESDFLKALGRVA